MDALLCCTVWYLLIGEMDEVHGDTLSDSSLQTSGDFQQQALRHLDELDNISQSIVLSCQDSSEICDPWLYISEFRQTIMLRVWQPMLGTYQAGPSLVLNAHTYSHSRH